MNIEDNLNIQINILFTIETLEMQQPKLLKNLKIGLLAYPLRIDNCHDSFSSLKLAFIFLKSVITKEEFEEWTKKMIYSFNNKILNEEEFRWSIFEEKQTECHPNILVWIKGFILALLWNK